ncbi:RluA family pseudouridine synthase [Colwellia psychrerythraea]|uniref:Pseudouridine synthase n=1 Tax=Colwellia psychrerythraea TaxID=28229 RepID=A0A099KMT0_COLPS|nr:RluA family pseudouridine synthase [Colwellia psychrerythraea]KGJ91781.1 pseudouridine synthase [Colwellia psychrerythraea]
MQMIEPCFTRFKSPIDSYTLPERFTFPFYYQPHPLCLVAAKELQDTLIKLPLSLFDYNESGKMFGVLIVKNKQGTLGYLSGFSGALAENNELRHFVPLVDDSTKAEFFKNEQKMINELNNQVILLEANPDLALKKQILAHLLSSAEQATSQLHSKNLRQRQARKARRVLAEKSLLDAEFIQLKEQLAKESVADKNELKYLKLTWQEKTIKAQQAVDSLFDVITSIKNKRSSMSKTLQQKLFAQYRFLNINQEVKNLTDLFIDTAFHNKYGVPPAGAGDCAAPKLLQYAFKVGLQPIALAEFWWGKSPKSEVRQHKNFYTACIGKCQPILTHMLSGMIIDDNPMLKNLSKDKNVEIIYQDDVMAVIDKPSELLSVPGKSISDCVHSRMKLLFPKATGPLIVHRLDMSTSGLMVIALTKQAHKNLQQQFIKRTVEKRYVALLSGCPKQLIDQKEGLINLPLAGDFDDRPRQMVCFDTGKEAQTKWQRVGFEEQNGQTLTRVHLYPKTGRTHQLRVHCAHHLGFNTPIVGDDLYGTTAKRLHLHAETLKLKHPTAGEVIEFYAAAKF